MARVGFSPVMRRPLFICRKNLAFSLSDILPLFINYDMQVWNNTTSGGGNSASYAIDGNTVTYWESNAAANNWLSLDLGSAQDVTAMTIYLDTTATTETQFLLQSSPDAVSWTNLRTINVSALSDAAYNYIRFMSNNDRYFRIYGNSGASSVMKINEVALQPISISSHGHLSIDPTDATLALNGE